jgi:hypothetical protein
MIHYVFQSLVRGINDQGIPVVSLQYYSVLDAQLVIRQLLHLPLQAVGRLGEELHVAQVAAVLQTDLVKEETPLTVQEVPVEVVEEASVSEEGC